MKAFTLLIILVSVLPISFVSCSQNSKFDCEETLKEKPYSTTFHDEWNQDSINRDVEILSECGNLDSVDCEIFQGPMLSVILIDEMRQVDNYDEITFQTCLDLIKIYKTKHKTDYVWLYSGTAARMKIEKLQVKLEEFETMRSQLAATGMKKEDLDAFKIFLEKHNINWTYKEAAKAFFEAQQSTIKSGKPMKFPNLENIDSALKEAKASKKNCLIYFSGWACVNARKFENQLLTIPEIQKTIQDYFIYKVAYVDEKIKLEGEEGNIGDKHTKLQVEKFKSSSQPYLYILSPDGKILAEWKYADGVEAFKSFLEKK